MRSHVRGDDDARVVEEIRRPHGAAIGDGAARDARSRRHHVAGNGVHARGGASRDGHERPVRLDQAEPRRPHAQDRQDALDGSPAYVPHVEALRERLREPGQRLRFVLPPAGLVVEPDIVLGQGLGAAPPRLARGAVTRVPDGRGRLHDECLQAAALPDAQLERRTPQQGEHAQERALEHDGQAQIAGEAARLAPVSGHELRIVGDAADVQRPAMERDPAGSAASVGLGAKGILAPEPIVGHRPLL